MIEIKLIEVMGLQGAIHGMRNPKKSQERADSKIEYGHFIMGNNDHKLAMELVSGGSVHAKFRRMIHVQLDINAPLYWWKEFDTYKVGTVADSESTMHTIHKKEFEVSDFSTDHLSDGGKGVLSYTIKALNFFREEFLTKKDKAAWWNMIQLLPTSYNQSRTVDLNYETLSQMYYWRKNHKLDEWQEFCEWIKGLPYSELFRGEWR